MKTNNVLCILAGVLLLASCVWEKTSSPAPVSKSAASRRDIARMLASLPLEAEQVGEVYDAVSSSSGNGYDEEYMMSDLLTMPGAGVGDTYLKASTKASSYRRPIKDLIEEYLARDLASSTKAGAGDVQAYLDGLMNSGLQIYWPYSEDWDGITMPVVTFDPGSGADSNYGYIIAEDDGRYIVTDSVFIDEAVARTRPVWVINSNDDSGYVPLSSLLKSKALLDELEAEEDDAGEDKYNLYIKDFTMLRNYDSWFAGGSEFWVKVGAVSAFYAGTEEELKNYTPSVTDFIVVVKRNEIGVKKHFNALMVTDFSDQIDKIAFLITEDDGGTITTWKCSTSVKIKSKTWGFDLEIPLHQYDDIVWRGQLGSSYFRKGREIEGRFGDVMITFSLEN